MILDQIWILRSFPILVMEQLTPKSLSRDIDFIIYVEQVNPAVLRELSSNLSDSILCSNHSIRMFLPDICNTKSQVCSHWNELARPTKSWSESNPSKSCPIPCLGQKFKTLIQIDNKWASRTVWVRDNCPSWWFLIKAYVKGPHLLLHLALFFDVSKT